MMSTLDIKARILAALTLSFDTHPPAQLEDLQRAIDRKPARRSPEKARAKAERKARKAARRKGRK